LDFPSKSKFLGGKQRKYLFRVLISKALEFLNQLEKPKAILLIIKVKLSQ